MTIPSFTFTRNPSVKVSVATSVNGLVGADNQLVLVGRMAASGSTVSAGVPTIINNYGDPVAAATECAGYFGVASEIGAMVVAAISAVLYSDKQVKAYPPITVYPMASGAASSTLSTFLSGFLSLPAPYIASPFAAEDSTALNAISNFATAISAADRGDNGQFGSFAFAASLAGISTISPVGIAAASQTVVIPWIQDTGGTPANSVAQAAAAGAALCASNGIPYLPLTGTVVGGLLAPVNHADWLTNGDTGTVALGLAAGLTPLFVAPSGKVKLSRSITTSRKVSSVADSAYYDVQDWQVLYYLRKVCYSLAMQPQYRQAKASVPVLKALKSDIYSACLDMEDLGMLQYVKKFADQFTVNLQPGNRNAAVYNVPVNVTPILANVGVAITGTITFDGTGL